MRWSVLTAPGRGSRKPAKNDDWEEIWGKSLDGVF